MGALTVDRDAWDDARRALGDDELPFTPYLLPRSERLTLAKRLSDAGWSHVAIAVAFGVSSTTVDRWLSGDRQPDWAKLNGHEGRKAVRYGSRRRSRSPQRMQPEAVTVDRDAEPWAPTPEDDPEPGGWDDDEDDDWDDNEAADLDAEPAPRPQAKQAKAKPYGFLSDVVAARAAAAGYPLTAAGAIDWDAYNRRQATPQGPPEAASTPDGTGDAPGTVPRAADVTPSTPTPVPSAAPKRATGTVDVVLDCGHVEAGLPVDGPWHSRGWVACGACGMAHRQPRKLRPNP